MRLLLDTHTLLWFHTTPKKLSSTALSAIVDQGNDKFVSPASYWELAIKVASGRYTLSVPYLDFLREAVDQNGFKYLPIEPLHTAALIALPYYRKDPFDRLLIVQGIVEGLTIVSVDTAFDAYPVTRLW